jgi:hypothetical protein
LDYWIIEGEIEYAWEIGADWLLPEDKGMGLGGV